MVQEKADSDAAAAEGTSQMWVAQKYIEQPLIINRRYFALLLLMMCRLPLQSLVCIIQAAHAAHAVLLCRTALQPCLSFDTETTHDQKPCSVRAVAAVQSTKNKGLHFCARLIPCCGACAQIGNVGGILVSGLQM